MGLALKNAAYPCMECKSRHPGCHGTCEEYNKVNAEYKSMKKALQPMIDIEVALQNIAYRERHLKKR